jgi:hypothetical protein
MLFLFYLFFIINNKKFFFLYYIIIPFIFIIILNFLKPSNNIITYSDSKFQYNSIEILNKNIRPPPLPQVINVPGHVINNPAPPIMIDLPETIIPNIGKLVRDQKAIQDVITNTISGSAYSASLRLYLATALLPYNYTIFGH